MTNNFKSFKSFLDKHSQKILWAAIFFYCLIFSLVSVWKYNHYLYNGLDLAIYNQTFYNTSFGRFLENSIHPPTYLADHFEPLILPLSFIYSFGRDPKMLLILQSLILGLGALPVYLISKEVFKEFGFKNIYALAASLIFLLNPLIQNINLFEYHILPWALFFILFAFYFYQKKQFYPYLIFIILALFVREDVPLIIFMFGPIYLIDFYRQEKNLKLKCKDWLWVFVPMILALAWFFFALGVITFFNPDNHYKFLSYYSWLGDSFGGIIFGILRHPLKVFLHLLSIGNLEMILGFLFSFLLLPLFYPLYLLLALGVFVQIILGALGGSELILETHYSTLFLPALIISSLYGAKKILTEKDVWLNHLSLKKQNQFFIISYFRQTLKILVCEKELIITILAAAVIFFNLTLGPLGGFAVEYFKNNNEEKNIKDWFLAKIPPEASVIADYNFLPHLSSRENLAALNYVFFGKKQMSQQPYTLPLEIDWLIVDFDDFLHFQLQYEGKSEFDADYQKGPNNIKKVLKDNNLSLVEIYDTLALFGRKGTEEFNLIQIKKANLQSQEVINLNNEIEYLGSSKPLVLEQNINGQQIRLLQSILSWQAIQKLNKNYQLKLTLEDETSKILSERIYPLAYGLYPTTFWQPGEQIEITYYFLIHRKFEKEKIKVWLNLIEVGGVGRLSTFRFVFHDYQKKVEIGEKILLTTIN